MKDCHTAIAKSGTVTLELALHKKPTVVVYELSLLNWLFAKYALKINLPHYCIVNILTGKTVFPELIACGFSAQNLCHQLELHHTDSLQRQKCIDECQEATRLLQGSHPSKEAFLAIKEVCSQELSD
jgi:lipid-A-disaccharide synthase